MRLKRDWSQILDQSRAAFPAVAIISYDVTVEIFFVELL
jgi:hypothetical protein